MALNMVQAAGAAAVGVGSGLLEGQPAVNLGGQSVEASMLGEIVAAIGGVAAQYFMPYTAPSLVDGIVDGAVALLGKRAVRMVGTTSPMWAGPMATRVSGMNGARPLQGGVRALNASGVGSNKYQFV